MGVIRFSLKVFVAIFLVALIAIAIHSWLLSKSYVFNHKVIASMTNKAIATAKSGESCARSCVCCFLVPGK